MPLFQYFGWVGSVLLAALLGANWWLSGNVADATPPTARLSAGIRIRIHSDHQWPERVVFDTKRSMLAPAENAHGQEAGQEPVAAERHDPAEAFAEMGRENVEGCLQPLCSADQNPGSDASSRRRAALLRSHPGASRAARAFTAPNPFHRLPGKS
jgi:hypothetical protein